MTRTPPQSPPLRRSPRHDKRKNRSESDVRKDVIRKSAGRTGTKKQRKNVTKTPAAASKGEKLPVFESSDDDDDVASSKSSVGDSSKEEDESSASSRSPPATIKNKKKTKTLKTSDASKQQQQKKKKPRQKNISCH